MSYRSKCQVAWAARALWRDERTGGELALGDDVVVRSALRYDRPRRVRLDGKRAGELAAGADAEFGEDLPKMVGDGGWADEQLCRDLGVGGPLAGQAGDQRLLRGQDAGCPGGAFEHLCAGRAQLGPRPFGERLHADAREQRVGA